MSDTEQKQQTEDPYVRQGELNARQRADAIGIQKQHEQVSKHKFNPGFHKETSDPDLDSEKWDWLENELGPKTSRAHVLGDLPEEHGEVQSLLNRNAAERFIAEREWGYLLKKNPAVAAVYMGVQPGEGAILEPSKWLDDPAAVLPLENAEAQRAVRDAYEALTTRESLAQEGKWADALTTATTETIHSDQVDEDVSETSRRLSGVFR